MKLKCMSLKICRNGTQVVAGKRILTELSPLDIRGRYVVSTGETKRYIWK
jgi:hypothetical protein